MDLLGRLFTFTPMKDLENKKFTNLFTRNISELASLKLVMCDQRIFSNIAADTLTLTETVNKFSQSSKGLFMMMGWGGGGGGRTRANSFFLVGPKDPKISALTNFFGAHFSGRTRRHTTRLNYCVDTNKTLL